MTGLVAGAVVVGPWLLVRAAVAIAHEGGHALSWLTQDPFKLFLVYLAGYVGPPLFGVAGAMPLSAGRVRPTLWLSLPW